MSCAYECVQLYKYLWQFWEHLIPLNYELGGPLEEDCNSGRGDQSVFGENVKEKLTMLEVQTSFEEMCFGPENSTRYFCLLFFLILPLHEDVVGCSCQQAFSMHTSTQRLEELARFSIFGFMLQFQILSPPQNLTGSSCQTELKKSLADREPGLLF